ncbi:MAG: hypothetical protein O3C60_01420 [Planctomycetota bacterium]|nr:hypothetical protein [Planctomycetota bacterium]
MPDPNENLSSDRPKDSMGEWISALKQQRDEIALQIHLAEMEARDEFDKAQQRLDRLADDYEPLKKAVAESADSIWESLKIVAGEVKSSFDRIRETL